MTIEICGKTYAVAKLTLKELRIIREWSSRAEAPAIDLKEINALAAEALGIIAAALHRADAGCPLTIEGLENSMNADDLVAVVLELVRISINPTPQPN